MNNLGYGAVMLVAGFGVPVLAALNAALGQRIGSPATAAVVLFSVALLCAFAVVLLTGPAALGRLSGLPPRLFLAGMLIAFYVLSITWIAPRFGVGNAVFFVLLGQLVSAAAIDHFGLMGARVEPLTLTRAAGILVMVAGVVLTQRA